MSVVLLILKILGITLLVLLGLALFLLTLVLWVPFRYAGNVVYKEQGEGHGRVSWLLRIFTFRFDYADRKASSLMSAFGIPLKGREKQSGSEAGNEEDEVTEDEAEEAEAETSDDKTAHEASQNDVNAASAGDGSAAEGFGNKEAEKDASVTEEAGKEVSAPEKTGKEKSAFRAKLDDLKHLFIETDRGQRALSHVLKYMRKIIRSTLPKKGTGYLRFGFDAPDVTGKVLAFLCAAYPPRKKGIALQPDFLEPCFECDVTFEGRLILGWLLVLLLALVLNRDVLYVIKRFRSKKTA